MWISETHVAKVSTQSIWTRV